MQDGECVRASQCFDGTYANIETLTCEPCSQECLTCSLTEYSCTSCQNSTLVLFNSTCNAECPSDYDYENEGVCTTCESPCVTCINQTHCLSCEQGYKYSSTTNLCSSTCGIGTYFNTTINDCSECGSNCIICESISFCYLCGDGYYLHVADPQTS